MGNSPIDERDLFAMLPGHADTSLRQRDKAAKCRDRRVARLRRHETKSAAQLANTLESCKPTDPCCTAGCVRCDRVIKKHLNRQFRRFLRRHGKGRKIAFLVLVLPSATVEPGKLVDFEFDNLKRRYKYLFDQAGAGSVIGCLDYSLNWHKEGRYQPHWSVHVQGFIVTDDIPRLQRRLSALVKKTDVEPKPVRLVEWDGKKTAVGYVLKTWFRRRKGMEGAERYVPSAGKLNPSRTTNKQRLLAAEKVELTLHLHHIGWQGRLFLRHVQLRRSPTGPKIVLIENHRKARRRKGE